MISLQELLRRFRRAWAPPGPALTRVAPPVDVTARLREEIGPLLARIAECQERAGAIEKEAEEKAKEALEAASREATGKIQDAEKRASSVRAEAAAKEQEAVSREIQSALDSARKEVQRIEALSQERLPQLVEQIVDCVSKGRESLS
jgi:vacuolar-type H+-ATPase subunit H